MNIASDISNLLGRFGANANGYLEVENNIEYKELPKKPAAAAAPSNPPEVAGEAEAAPPAAEQEILAAAAPAEAQDHAVVAGERVEPIIDELAASITDAAAPRTSAETAGAELSPSPILSTSLRSLLAEVALKREALTRAEGAEGSVHGALSGVPPSTPAQVIAVVSPKGGVGKTTLSAALAGALEAKGRVIAVDLDPQNALQYHLGAASDAVSPTDVARAEDRWSWLLRDGAAGVGVLSYKALSKDQPQALEQHIRKDRHWLARHLACMNLGAGDVVILDTPGGRTPYLDQALDVADQVLVVLTPDAGSFMALEHMEEMLDGRDDCTYVVNQFDASRTFCQDMLEVLKRRFGGKLVGAVPLDHAVGEGLAYGVNILMQAGKSPAWPQVRAVAAALEAAAQTQVLAGARA